MCITSAAILIGVAGGAVLAHLSWKLRSQDPKHELLDDLVGLSLIAVVYCLSVSVHAWGFLTVFVAGVALRQTELKLAGVAAKDKKQRQSDDPDVAASAEIDENNSPLIVSAEKLIFEKHLERLSELLLVLLLGGMLLFDYWSWRTIGLALFVFFMARPISVLIGLMGTDVSWRIRGMAGWFGVRGIGSIYYLMYVIQHGLPADLAKELIQLTLIVITLSIFLHGTSVKPLMNKY